MCCSASTSKVIFVAFFWLTFECCVLNFLQFRGGYRKVKKDGNLFVRNKLSFPEINGPKIIQSNYLRDASSKMQYSAEFAQSMSQAQKQANSKKNLKSIKRKKQKKKKTASKLMPSSRSRPISSNLRKNTSKDATRSHISGALSHVRDVSNLGSLDRLRTSNVSKTPKITNHKLRRKMKNSFNTKNLIQKTTRRIKMIGRFTGKLSSSGNKDNFQSINVKLNKKEKLDSRSVVKTPRSKMTKSVKAITRRKSLHSSKLGVQLESAKKKRNKKGRRKKEVKQVISRKAIWSRDVSIDPKKKRVSKPVLSKKKPKKNDYF